MSTLPHFSRRRLIPRALALVAVAAFPVARLASGQPRPALEPTPPDAEGPFYPTALPANAGSDLTRIPGRSERAKGPSLDLSGRVLRPDGEPLAKAKVELWQCDTLGRYHHVGGGGQLDENFQGYGAVETDSAGRFAFRTIRPVPYSGRPPHLHFKLAHASARPLTTQIYPKGESAERFGGFGLSSREARSRLEFALREKAPGAFEATYDFVLRA